MNWLVLILGILVYGCNADSLNDVASGNAKFTANVYKKVIQTESGNVVLSGLSAEIILSLLANGAKGDTQKQLLTVLNLPSDQQSRDQAFEQITTSLNINTDDLKLLSANRLYPAKTFCISQSFKDVAVNVYKSGIQKLNYNNAQQAADTINSWVEQQTNNKIKNLVDPSQLSSSTVLVLVNALYLLAQWKRPFEKFNSQPRLFYTSETATKSIDTMYTETIAKYKHSSKLKAKFLELDFKGGDICMVFVLPDKKTGLSAVENDLDKYLVPMKYDNAYVGITLPKFTINTKIDFTSILQQLGATTMFTNQADLSGISSGGGLKVSFVVQKAFIGVNEDGVEAAAATAVGIVRTSLPAPAEIFFKADHPFFWYIKMKNSGLILFAGRFNG